MKEKILVGRCHLEKPECWTVSYMGNEVINNDYKHDVERKGIRNLAEIRKLTNDYSLEIDISQV